MSINLHPFPDKENSSEVPYLTSNIQNNSNIKSSFSNFENLRENSADELKNKPIPNDSQKIRTFEKLKDCAREKIINYSLETNWDCGLGANTAGEKIGGYNKNYTYAVNMERSFQKRGQKNNLNRSKLSEASIPDHMAEIKSEFGGNSVEFLILIAIDLFPECTLRVYEGIKIPNNILFLDIALDIKARHNKFDLYSLIILLSAANNEFNMDYGDDLLTNFLNINQDVYEDDAIDTIQNMFAFIDYMAKKYALSAKDKRVIMFFYFNLVNNILDTNNLKKIVDKKRLLSTLQTLLFDGNQRLRRELEIYFLKKDFLYSIYFFNQMVIFIIEYIPEKEYVDLCPDSVIVSLKTVYNSLRSIIKNSESKIEGKYFLPIQRCFLSIVKNPQYGKKSRFWAKILSFLLRFRKCYIHVFNETHLRDIETENKKTIMDHGKCELSTFVDFFEEIESKKELLLIPNKLFLEFKKSYDLIPDKYKNADRNEEK